MGIRKFIFLISLFAVQHLMGQAAAVVEVFSISGDNGSVHLMASNQSVIPYFVRIDELILENMEVHPRSAYQKTLQPGERFILATLIPVHVGVSKWDFRYTKNPGDPAGASAPDANFIYRLPFSRGRACLVTQGYMGSVSHNHTFAIDFMMEEGTPVCAARDGVVVEVKEDSDYGCPSQECAKFGNYILIMHRDGTFAGYWHLKYRGAVVEPGQQVRTGDVIGYSGNTGWSSGPHLHFEVFRQTPEGKQTLSTFFATQRSPRTMIESGKLYWH